MVSTIRPKRSRSVYLSPAVPVGEVEVGSPVVFQADEGAEPEVAHAGKDGGRAGDVGHLVRAAEASGAAGVVFAGTSTDAFGPKTVRAAAGSLLRLPVAEVAEIEECIEGLRASGRVLIATVAGGGTAPDALDLTVPLAVLIGSEAHGLPESVIAACDLRLTIPVAATVESLNAAVAGAVVMFEASRQRRS